jgi:DnaD/phage-associated family protein
MAKRRMFSLDIIDTDLFMEMPQTSRLLYYELCMRADDDGFVGSPKKIQKMVGCSEDDFKVLISKQFIIPFDTGIVVIKHWKIHNYLRSDRYKETIYTSEKKLLSQDENGMYTIGIPNGYQMDTQDRLGKDRLGKDRIDNIVVCYEQNIGVMNPAAAELIFSYLDDFQEEMIIQAIKIASQKNKKNASYINGILRDWKNKGYKVLADVNQENSLKSTKSLIDEIWEEQNG